MAAALARGADSGAAVGFVLLAATTPGLANPALTGALLVTCMTVPHLFGPLLAGRLDRAADARRPIAAVIVCYGTAIAAAVVTMGRAPLIVVAGLAALAGLCGPLLTGGLSSMLPALVRDDPRAQGRAQGMDSMTYGIAGTAGPAAVAASAGLIGARPAVLALAAGTVIAAALLLTLPRPSRAVHPDAVLSALSTVRVLLTCGPLRRVLYMTLVSAAPGGGLTVLAVALAPQLDVGPGPAALMAAAFGCGNLSGALVLTVRPLLGEPERLVSVCAAALGAAYLVCAAVPGYGVALAAFFVVGVANAPLFTSTLAARTRYSPPGARAQVFVWMAALKVGAIAAGAAGIGAAISLGPRVLLVIAGGAVLTTSAVTFVDRALTRHDRAVVPQSR